MALPPVALGDAAVEAATVVCPIGSAVSAGQLVAVFVAFSTAATTGASVVDSQGNIYNSVAAIRVNNPSCLAFVATITKPLSTTDTITYSQNATGSLTISAAALSGYSMIDSAYTNTLGETSTSYSITGKTSALQPNELNIGFLYTFQHPANTAAGFTTIANVTPQGGGSAYTAFQVNPVQTPLTFAGTNSQNAQLSTLIIAFVPAANPFTPKPRSKMMTLQQRGHSIGNPPRKVQGARITIPLILTSVLDGSSNFGTVETADLVMEDSEGVINNVQTMFVDASAMTFPMRLYFLETQQTIFINANSQGYYQIAVGQQVNLTATAFSHSGTDQANVTVVIQFLNVPMSTAVWIADGS
jgi:hypothetical protein